MFATVLVTAPDSETASTLAHTLVTERLAACVNIIPAIRSIYRWQGEVHDEAESLMVIKTQRTHFPRLEARILELHPYEVPEAILLPIEAGSERYLSWLAEETSPEEPPATA